MPQKKKKKAARSQPLLVETAWEVCNQVGGIYTVIRSKVPSIVEKRKNNYCLLGPYINDQIKTEYEIINDSDNPFCQAVQRLQKKGLEIYFGHWLVTGRPQVVLANPFCVYEHLGEIKYLLWEHHDISFAGNDDLINNLLAFSYIVKQFFTELCHVNKANGQNPIIGHFHEWMGGISIPQLRREHLPIKIIFTTHATLLGRYLAMSNPCFYDHLPFMDWQKEAGHFNIEGQVRLERAAAHGAHVFTTVSEVTARECYYLLNRQPDFILPNGLNISRFVALHEFQNLHRQYKAKINQFVMSHFFHCYHFDLDKTLFFFTSGRFEFRNKGFDLTLEALKDLNNRLKAEKSDMTIVMFFITKRPFQTINPEVLHSRAIMEEIRENCESIQNQIKEHLFYEVTTNDDFKLPQLNNFVDDYWKLRLRRTLQSWKSKRLPLIVTHNLVNDGEDEILNSLRFSNMVNGPDEKVKVIYHPDFISSINPLFNMDYDHFVRGCHLGIFPSYYEPWGYTPLECMARGIPAVTSDLSGFGDYVLGNYADPQKRGIYVVKRKGRDFIAAQKQLTDFLYSFVQQNRRMRIDQRNRTESCSVSFSWQNLIRFYERAYKKVLKATD